MSEIPKEILELLIDIAKSENFIEYAFKFSDISQNINTFLSDILCLKIVGKQRSSDGVVSNGKLNLICKSAFSIASQREQYKTDVMFEREVFFYQTLAPEFLKFQRERGLEEMEIFAAFPKCFKAICDEEKGIYIIILEDLRPKQFKVFPKLKINNAENIRKVLIELARFHAVSFAMKDQCPQSFKKYKELSDLWPSFLTSGAFNKIYRHVYQRSIKILDNEKYKQIYKILLENLNKYILSWSDDNSMPRVVGHGDLHDSNILFKCNPINSDKADEISIIDWQYIRYVSPAFDIFFYISLSTDKQARDANYDDWLQLYYEQLSTSIRQLGSDPNVLYSRDDFMNGLKLCGNFPFIIAPTCLFYRYTDQDDLEKMRNLSEAEQENTSIKEIDEAYKDCYKKRLTDLLDHFYSLGYFQELK